VRLITGSTPYDPTQTTITVPSGQLQAITNTSLLTCAYSTFRDGSTNNFTITVNGNTAVSTQNPFPLTTLPNPALGNQGNGVYTMSQYQSLLSQNLWPAVDPYWRYVTLMLHGNGTNGAQNNTFLDSSTNNFTITRNGNTTQGTFSPYGSNWSNYTGNAASAATRVDVSGTSGIFGTNVSYTMEGWFNFTADSSGDASNIITYNTNTFPTRWFWDAQISSGTLYLRLYTESNSTVFNGSTIPYTLGTWVHLAVVNNNTANTCTFYVNGVAAGTRAKVSLTAASTLNLLCNSSSVSAATPFYVSNFRIVNGAALYSSNFTPSTSPLTAVSGTALLTFQSNRFVDNSGSNLTLTPYSTNQIQRFSPFNPTAPYAAGTDGGSGYFDGSGDYVTMADNTALNLASGDFTIECWFYQTVSGASGPLWHRFNGNYATQGDFQYALYTNSDNTVTVRPYSGSVTDYTINVGSFVPNTWNHVALVRTGNTFYGYLNGVRAATTQTISGSLNNGTWLTYLGASLSSTLGNSFFTGYVCGARITKGGALYTGSTFTLPTAPFTTTVSAGTVSALLNFTNAGIIDNAEMNNLETVGNAQISTAQSKFGGASMAFDGTGDYLQSPSSPQFSFDGDITIEAWIYPSVLSGSTAYAICGTHSGVNDGKTEFYVYGTGRIAVGRVGVNEIASATGIISTGTWYHVAAVRNGSTTTVYVNGASVASGTTAVWSTGASPIYVAYFNPSNGANWNGYIDDFRITKGYARYTSTFTPQRSQWQDQ
jgi:hypothetical protein